MILSICVTFAIGVIATICYLYSQQKNKKSIKGKHVVISGGSSGIGLNVAIEAVQQGANVTLLARNTDRLKAAEEELKNVSAKIPPEERGNIQHFSVDVGGPRKLIGEAVQSAENSFGPVYMLVNCAGFAKAARFEDLTEDSVRSMVNVNFLGSFFLTQEVVKSMKRHNEGGIIVFVSSLGGLVGLFGFTAYAGSKAALIKFAEALHMELKPWNITVTVSYPPDTETPGLEEENKSKPVETKLLSESGGLFKPDEVASSLMNDALVGKFQNTVGFEGFMLTSLCAGMAPVTDFISFVTQVTLSGVFRAASAYFLWDFSRIVNREHQKRLSSKKVE